MTKDEIFKILTQVFQEFNVKIIDKNTWSKISVDDRLEVYTYSGLPDRDDNIWYFSVYYNGQSKEIMIPKKNSSEFIEEFKEIYLDVIKAREILKTVSDRLSSIGDIKNIRDRRITNIINYD